MLSRGRQSRRRSPREHGLRPSSPICTSQFTILASRNGALTSFAPVLANKQIEAQPLDPSRASRIKT
jgi:hypothetical protein